MNFFNNKGDANLLFKWIFGVIAGGLILLFFVRFSWVHIEGGQTLEGQQILLDIDDRLDAFGVGEQYDTFDLRDDFDLTFQCRDIRVGQLGTVNHYSRTTPHALFAPPQLSGEYLTVWTRQWSYPYPIAQLYYLSNPSTRIFVVSDTSSLDEVQTLVERIPEPFNVKIIPRNSFDPTFLASQLKGAETATVAFFGSPPNNVEELYSVVRTYTPLTVILINQDQQTATVTDSDGRSEDVYYLNDDVLYGLLFSGSGYQCVQTHTIQRLRSITQLYEHKLSRLIGKIQDQHCRDLFQEGTLLLQRFEQAITKQEYTIVHDKLIQHNIKMEGAQCPTIY